ncbi:MAG TPA: hypothetical protein RMH85_20560 [Polyangiaceae bacterium LLY-WYZ-15_(1-7)]|nr:hypothetical protein [Polyangiaceae bacterium LLY-WYZ-15_(1-7)]HJL10878.1 hypothetical protein [Polyangiaceae bacterium LLY-WYZ-15_(1-7)]HJL27510.1 hypothetical protein [Polyangiaceae bacterium LLY-WYZ-15_(1-7)]HJL49541.1 hypothetical protein [Polyangiaceae bacterium LLY-WYZ-15_(1-7)]
MEASTLAHILGAAPGITETKGTFEVEEGHRVTFYLGQPGQAMIVRGIVRVRLEDEYVHLGREGDGELFLTYGAVHGVGVQPPEEAAKRRAGFS